jgi:hypothetical protein
MSASIQIRPFHISVEPASRPAADISAATSRIHGIFTKFFGDSKGQTRTFFQIFNNLANGTALALSASSSG